MTCSVCASVLPVVRIRGCGHLACGPCWQSSCFCLCAECMSPSVDCDPLEPRSADAPAVCLQCDEALMLSESGISMPCPHSVWLCTADVPPDLAGLATVGPLRRPADRAPQTGMQRFRTPRQTGGTDCHFAVLPDTDLLWNPDLSIRLLDDRRIVVVHCMRNLRVRLGSAELTLLRGTFDETVLVASRPQFVSIMAPQRVVNKVGPCRLLGLRPFDQNWLLSEPFQYFTHPMLNPALSGSTDRGILVGTQPAVAGMTLRDVLVARGALQCARCRHIWTVRSRFDHENIEGFIHNCGVFGLLAGHMQPVVETALAIPEYAPPEPADLAAWAPVFDLREALTFAERWRRLPYGGPGALEIPGICLVAGDIGLLDVEVASELPVASRAELQALLVHLRNRDEWQQLPDPTLMCFRHLETNIMLYSRTCNNSLFFKRS
jgi:hypothetical protein